MRGWTHWSQVQCVCVCVLHCWRQEDQHRNLVCVRGVGRRGSEGPAKPCEVMSRNMTTCTIECDMKVGLKQCGRHLRPHVAMGSYVNDVIGMLSDVCVIL